MTIFAQMLEIVALSDLASVLCARKFSFAPQAGVLQITPFHLLLFFYYYYYYYGRKYLFCAECLHLDQTYHLIV